MLIAHQTSSLGEDKTEVLSGLQDPHGVAVSGDNLFVLDRVGRAIHRVNLSRKDSDVIAEGLPFGSESGIAPKPLPSMAGLLPGPLLPFAGLAVDSRRTLCASADGEGSVLALHRA